MSSNPVPDRLPKLYTEFASWWPLLSAPEEYEEDAAIYTSLLQELSDGTTHTVLELGSGGGNNASFMKQTFALTLCDRSPEMLAVSRDLNPQCEHIEGDMRTLRLGRLFDAVFIHDAIIYMNTPADLKRAIQTAFLHCRPGASALFVPDYTEESFLSATYHGGHDGDTGFMRYLQWDHDPIPNDGQYNVNMAYIFQPKGGQTPTMAGETHTCGLFSTETWHEIIQSVGFIPGSVCIETDDLECGTYTIFSGRRPSAT